MDLREEIVECGRSWIGCPWRHQGRARWGIDCAGLVICVGREAGASDYDTTAYPRRPNGDAFVQHFRDAGCVEIPVDTAQPGDILIFRDDAYPCHSAIVSEKHGVPHIIHAHASRRMVVEEPLTNEWPARRVAAFRYPMVEA